MVITDEDSARAWLETQSDPRIAIAFAARAALRAAPGLGLADPDNLNAIVLPTLRAVLLSGVAGQWSADQLIGEYRNVFSGASLSARRAADRSTLAINRAAYWAIDAADATSISHFHTTTSSAAEAAASSSAFAAERSFSACDWDAAHLSDDDLAKQKIQTVFARPLWPSKAHRDIPPGEPEELASGYAKLTEFFDSDPAWDFWKGWLDGMRRGEPEPWKLQEQIALIQDNTWKDGPGEIAKEIARIKATFEPRPLQAEAAASQAEWLIQNGQTSALSAKGMSQLIQMATQAYLREVENRLPEELEPLERLPPLLDQIALEIAGAGLTAPQNAELADLLQKMATTIAVLNQRLTRANEELEAAKRVSRSSAKTLMRDSFYSKLGERGAEWITSPMLWGGIAMGSGFLLGSDAHALIEALGECYDSTIAPHAPSAAPLTPTLPSTEQL